MRKIHSQGKPSREHQKKRYDFLNIPNKPFFSFSCFLRGGAECQTAGGFLGGAVEDLGACFTGVFFGGCFCGGCFCEVDAPEGFFLVGLLVPTVVDIRLAVPGFME